METMKAVRIQRFGGPEVLQLEDIAIPRPQADEILVHVTAASVNPVDYKIRRGGYPAVGADKLPVTMGRDLCGTVAACGGAVQAHQAGDEVYALLGRERGSNAEYVVLKTGEYAPKPPGLDPAQAAAVPLAALTAWQGLFDHGGLQAGERVLIHGGSGGVGHFAIQFAKARGAEVLTTVGPDDLQFARQLGADRVIDYKHQRFEDFAADVDLVFDLIGGETQERSWAVLKQGGRLISTLAEPSPEQARRRQARAARYMAQPDAAQLRQIGELIGQGRVRPFVERIFPLDQAAAAHRHLEHDHVRGKVVLQVAPAGLHRAAAA